MRIEHKKHCGERISKNLQAMPVCATPIFKIYEDFDKISAKEVYFTDSGDKITVKLLHFPHINPEEQAKMFMSDSGDDNVVTDDEKSQTEDEGAHQQRVVRKKTSVPRKTSQESIRRSSIGSSKHGNNDQQQQQQQSHHLHHHHHHHHHHHNHSHGHTIITPPGNENLRRNLLQRRSPSPCGLTRDGFPLSQTGYEQYSNSFLKVPLPRDYGDASSDDLSSEWDSDASELKSEKVPKVNTVHSAILQ
jgi:hypothetical protein